MLLEQAAVALIMMGTDTHKHTHTEREREREREREMCGAKRMFCAERQKDKCHGISLFPWHSVTRSVPSLGR